MCFSKLGGFEKVTSSGGGGENEGGFQRGVWTIDSPKFGVTFLKY